MANEFLNVEDLSEEDIDAILGLGTSEQRGSQLEQQLALAQKLRNSPGPEGRGYGGVYTAANPLEHAVHAWQGIRAGKDAERIANEQNELLNQQTEARKRFFEAMMRRQGLPQTQPQEQYGPGAMPNPGVY